MEKIIKKNQTVLKREPAGLQNKTRLNFLKGFIGTNRTGKSSIARDIADIWKSSRDERYNVITFDPQRRFADISDKGIDIEDEMWAVKLLREKNCLVILDDYRMINPGDKPIKGLPGLLYKRADNNMDIIYICHSPALVLNLFTYMTTEYYIFHTLSTDGSFKKKIPNYHLCITAVNEVNKYVRRNGRGEHAKSSDYSGQGFPYIIVNTEDHKLSAVNMDDNY